MGHVQAELMTSHPPKPAPSPLFPLLINSTAAHWDFLPGNLQVVLLYFLPLPPTSSQSLSLSGIPPKSVPFSPSPLPPPELRLPLCHTRTRQKLPYWFCSKLLLPKPSSTQARIILLNDKVHVTPLLKTFQWLTVDLRTKSPILNKYYKIYLAHSFSLSLYHPSWLPCLLWTPNPFSLPGACQLPPAQGPYPARLPSPHLDSSYSFISFLCWNATSSGKLFEPHVISPYCPIFLAMLCTFGHI